MPRGKESVSPSPHFHAFEQEKGWDVVHTASNLRVLNAVRIRVAKHAVNVLEQPKMLAAVLAVVASAQPDGPQDADSYDLVASLVSCCQQASRGIYVGPQWTQLEQAGVDVRHLKPAKLQNDGPVTAPPGVPTTPPPDASISAGTGGTQQEEIPVRTPPPEPAPVPPSDPGTFTKEVLVTAPAPTGGPVKYTGPAMIPGDHAKRPPDFDPDPLKDLRLQDEKARAKGEADETTFKCMADGLKATLDIDCTTAVHIEGTIDDETDVKIEVELSGFDAKFATWKVDGVEKSNEDLELELVDGKLRLTVNYTHTADASVDTYFHFDGVELAVAQDDAVYLELRQIVELAYRQNPEECRRLANALARHKTQVTMEPLDVVRNGGRA